MFSNKRLQSRRFAVFNEIGINLKMNEMVKHAKT